MAALSFWTTALSSAMVLAALTLRINCLTAQPSARVVQIHAHYADAIEGNWRRTGAHPCGPVDPRADLVDFFG